MTAGNRAPRRGRPPLLDVDLVVETALTILDDEGLRAVTFRRLSSELGVSHMTLYGYFDSKDALLEAMVARTIAVSSIQRPLTAPWDEVLFDAIQELHRVLVSRRGIADILVSQQLMGEWAADARNMFLDVLRGAGYDDRQATDGISILFNYLLGAVMIEARRGRGGSAASFDLGLRYLIAGLSSEPP